MTTRVKFVQITSAEAYYTGAGGAMHKHFTLFALDEDGRIWTRYYDGKEGVYREWYALDSPAKQ